jgi:predicted RNase H-related nuclease YkuK (DUF458 family)
MLKEIKMKNDIYAYPIIEEWEWKTYDGKKTINIDSFIEDHIEDEFYIGTDSQVKGNYTKFTTALIAYRRGTGGYIICFSQRTKDKGNMRPRLFSEAMRSLTAAYYLDLKIPKEAIINIHLDVNGNDNFKSHSCKEDIVGMIMYQGTRFKPMWKPDAWGSSKAADRKTK